MGNAALIDEQALARLEVQPQLVLRSVHDALDSVKCLERGGINRDTGATFILQRGPDSPGIQARAKRRALPTEHGKPGDRGLLRKAGGGPVER